MAVIAGAESTVNTDTTGIQSTPEIARLDGGGWVVTWSSYAQDGTGWGIYQQAYGADGVALGGETRVNTYTASSQDVASVRGLEGGGWVTIWVSYGQDGDGYGVFQQAYDADGLPVGGETQVNTTTAGSQSEHRVTACAGGGWVVNWVDPNHDGDNMGLFQQAFAADGSPLGGEIQVNSHTTSAQHFPKTVALANGGWVVTWLSYGQDGSEYGIYQQLYDADGVAAGTETRVTTETSANQSSQRVVALNDGGWVVTWQSDGQDGHGYGVYQQAFDSDGTARGVEARVNSSTANDQINQDIVALSDGGWVVVWRSNNTDGDGTGVYQQAFDADGSPRGDETLINTFTDNDQKDAVATALTGGGWVVTWVSTGQAGDIYGSIYLQAFNADGTAHGPETCVSENLANIQTDPRITALDDGGWVVTWEEVVNQDEWNISQRVFHIANSAPTVENEIAYQVATEDEAFTFQFAADVFVDVEGDSLTYTATLASGDELPAWLSFDADTRTFSGTPENGDVATISVKVTAGDGEFEVSETFDITVSGVNDAPLGADKTVTVAEDTGYTIAIADFAFTDDEGDDLSAVVIAALPTLGTLMLGGVAVTEGQAVAAADLDDLTWTPPRNANGDGLASFTFQVRDDGGSAWGGVDTDPVANTFAFDVTEVVDRFVGNAKANRLSGTAGQDYFRGKGGDDTLTGKAGADTFDFRAGDGADTIRDFAATGADHDVLDLSGLASVRNFKDLERNHMEKQGRDVIIEATGGDEILIQGVKIGDLDKSDFAF